MKKTLAILLCLCMLTALLAGCQGGSTPPANNGGAAPAADPQQSGGAAPQSPAAPATEGDINVGIFMPLTGPSSLMGNAGNNAAIMAVEQINAAGGILGRQLKLTSYDDKSSPEEAVKNVTRMLEVDKVAAIIGSLHSGNIQACGDIVEEAQIPLIGTGTSPQWLEKGWEYLFRSTLNTYYSSLSAVQICETLNLKTMAIFHSQDEYGKNGKDNMAALCEEYNIEIVSVESMKPGDTDFTGQCSNIVAAKPDCIYVIATTDNLPPMVKQIRANGYDSYIVGEQSLGMPEVKEIAGAGADKIVFGACFTMPINSPDEASTPELQKFFKDYLDRFGEMCPSEVAVRVYDGMFMLVKAIEDAGSTDGAAIREAYANISGYNALQGTFDYVGKNGEGLEKSRLYIIDGGKDVLLDEFLKK